MASAFSVGGLASGLDTQTIVDGFVKIEQIPIDQLRARQVAAKSQISVLGSLASQLSALDSATAALSTSGLAAVSVQSHALGYSATVQPGTQSAEYDVQVRTLASAGKARSQAYDAVDAQVPGGTLSFSVNGKHTDISITDGSKLNDVASQINASGAGVSAAVVWDGQKAYLTLSGQATGFTGTTADSALGVTFAQTGTTGQAPVTTITHAATNATFDVDGLTLTRQSNTVNDALKGVTLSLLAPTAATEPLVLARDGSTAQAHLQTFIDAYNVVALAVYGQLNPADVASRSGTLASSSTLESLQGHLQDLVSTSLSSTGGVRSLADLGLHTQKDGTLTLDAPTLQAAIARDPAAADSLFSTATTGAAALVHKLVTDQTDPVRGLLLGESASLTDQVKNMDTQATQMQVHVDAYRAQLVSQFSAMETIVSGLKNTAAYLTQLSNASSSTGK